MAKRIYEIKLTERFIPADSPEDAFMELEADMRAMLHERESFTISEVTMEDHTLKLFMLAKTMEDAERFTTEEIRCAVRALVWQMNYYSNAEEITECVLKWVERFDDLPINELEEWLIG